LNITVPDARLPYTSVTRLRGSAASVVLTMDKSGVMPLPAAKPR
jgi:hypothetical protein